MTLFPRLAVFSLASLGLLAATPAQAGVWIGNPIVVEAVATDASTLDSASGHLVEVKVEYCSRSGAYVEQVDQDIDLAVDGLVIDPPSGEYCGLTLVYDGSLSLSGDNNGNWSHGLGDEVFELEPNGSETGFKLDLEEVSAADIALIAE